jgi:hypothetical protein
MQRALNAIQMQGNSDEELDIEPAPEVLPVMNQEAPEQQQPPEQLMHISAAAYNGSPSDSTISLLLTMKGSNAIALADTGSTSTFLDYNYAVKHNIPMTPT